jgi:uncharacterized protein (TIGR03382 family)
VTAAIAGAAGLGLAAPANADISDIVLRIEATNQMGTAVYEGHVSDGAWHRNGQEYVWQSDSPITMLNQSGQTIAMFNGASIRCVSDPVVQLNFSVSAGSLATTFTITSPTLSFPAIDPASGRASAGVSVTDTDGDGASLTPSQQPGLYTAHYNGAVPGGTLFADLLNNAVVAGAFDSATASDSFPGGGAYSAIGTPVSDMSSRFRFTLTANDEASGTSTYEIIPAPGAATLLALGGLFASRRRRH